MTINQLDSLHDMHRVFEKHANAVVKAVDKTKCFIGVRMKTAVKVDMIANPIDGENTRKTNS